MLSNTIYLLLGYFLFVASEATRIVRSPHNWGYTSHNGPHTWEGICRVGLKQSPINIELGKAIIKNYPSFSFGADYLKKTTFNGINNGHSILVSMENKTYIPVVYGGGLDGKYIFSSLHFHWESEHEFEGKRADLEMHMVHFNSKYGSLEKASTQPDGLVVLAVLFNESEEKDNIFEDFFAQIINKARVAENSDQVSENIFTDDLEREKRELFSLRDLLPKHVSRFFRYKGSLTTPGCDENVVWTVFVNRFPVSREVLNNFRTFRDAEGNLLTTNFRSPQKLNGRELYLQIINYENEGRDNIGELNSGCGYNSALYIPLLCCALVTYFNLG